MKVYIYLLMVACFSVMLVGCTEDKKKIDFAIGDSSWIITVTGSISLNNSKNIAYINQFSWSVTIDTMTVVQGAIIHENSIIVTWSGSEAEIIFADSSVVRLSSDSRLQISKKWTDNTILDLQEWSVWARVLKPFTDTSFFTLETNDLSAWVRGTSVWMITNSGWTDIGIVDTTSTGWQSSGATVDIVDKAVFGTGNIILSEEDVLKVRHSKKIERVKMKLKEQIKIHPFVWVNTIRDIRYMEKIIQDPTSQMGTRGRVKMEMNVTMPSPDEVMIFLIDPTVRSEVKKQGSNEMTPNEFIRYLDIDKKIEEITNSELTESEKKKAIENTRKLIIETPTIPVTSTGSTGATVPPPIIKKPAVISVTRTTTVVSGEKAPCTIFVSGEPCR